MGSGSTIKPIASEQDYWNLTWANLMVEELSRLGVRQFVLAPGSRSTPLALAVAANDQADAIVHFDERGAAFYALGIARATGQAVAVICTSGTAAGNLLPAVMEASNDNIPLLVLTADRPSEKHGVGANQTIAQQGMFANYVRTQFNLPVPDDLHPLSDLLTSIDQGYRQAVGDNAGPVHFNCPYRKPLIPSPESAATIEWPDGLPQSWREGRDPFSTQTQSGSKCSADALRVLLSALAPIKSGLVVLGHLPHPDQQEAAARLANHLGWPVVADVTSGLRLGKRLKNQLVHFDYLIAADRNDLIHDDLTILHIGGRIVSQRLLEFSCSAKVGRYLMVNDPHVTFDPEGAVTDRINCKIVKIVDGLCGMLPQKASTQLTDILLSASERATVGINNHPGMTSTISEPLVARMVSQSIRPDAALFLASSMPVRDMNQFAILDGHEIPVGCNRGVSGIDGTIASAVGFAGGHRRPVTLVVGDLAALHDLNSLSLLRQSAQPITIIVINNNGGGIFSFLPVKAHDAAFESFFAATHGLRFEAFCKPFDIDYRGLQTVDEFRDAYCQSQTSENHTLIEVTTDRAENLALHQSLQQLAVEVIDNG